MSKPVFEYIQHDHNIHEFRHYVSSRQSVDESVAAIDAVLQQRPANDPNPLLFLSNTQESGDQPITYGMAQYRNLLQHHGEGIANGLHLALVHKGGAMINFWTSLFNLFRAGMVLKAFTDYDEALAWLRSIGQEADQPTT